MASNALRNGLLVWACGAFAAGATRTASGLEGGRLLVCTTVPDLGDLAREVGGDEVEVTVFAKGAQDPHFLEARPSFIKALSLADLFLEVGLELEIGWAPALLDNCRNGRVLPGAKGFLDASTAITPSDIPTGVVDRSLGDVHPLGNPHYLADPLNGLRVARAIRDKLTLVRPEKAAYFESRLQAFSNRLKKAMVGEALASRYDAEKLAVLNERGRLAQFLKEQGAESLLGGWIGRLLPVSGARVVADHNLWPYFARRFGLTVVGFLEPKPGIQPTTRHLSELVSLMKNAGVRAILTVPYFDPRHARFVSELTGAKALRLAHQCGAQPGTETYLELVDYNVRQLELLLGGAP